jgi:hypothetical protein
MLEFNTRKVLLISIVSALADSHILIGPRQFFGDNSYLIHSRHFHSPRHFLIFNNPRRIMKKLKEVIKAAATF